MMNIKFRSVIFTFSIVLLGFVSCQKDSNSDKLSIEFEKLRVELEVKTAELKRLSEQHEHQTPQPRTTSMILVQISVTIILCGFLWHHLYNVEERAWQENIN